MKSFVGTALLLVLAQAAWALADTSLPKLQMPVWKRPESNMAVDLEKMWQHCGKMTNVAACLRFMAMQQDGPLAPVDQLAGRRSTATYLRSWWKEEKEAAFPKPVVQQISEPMLFHTYWAGQPNAKTWLSIASFLFTQPLDRARLTIWCRDWSPEDGNAYIQEFLSMTQVEFKPFNMNQEVTLGRLGQEHEAFWHYDQTGYSDAVRFLVLHNYGGVYFDADTLLLRDFSPLWPYQYGYRWSWHPRMNTAILALFKNSSFSNAIWTAGQEARLATDTLAINFYHPEEVTMYMTTMAPAVANAVFEFPFALMDAFFLLDAEYATGQSQEEPVRPPFSYFGDFFEKRWQDLEPATDASDPGNETTFHFLDGAFAYHWHNAWQVPIQAESYAGHLQRFYREFLDGSSQNFYGEFFNKSHVHQLAKAPMRKMLEH